MLQGLRLLPLDVTMKQKRYRKYIMATLKEGPSQEDALEEQTPERRHVDDFLDISEEAFMKELEPYEYRCYCGWEEAVRGWARVAPMSCILMAQKRYKKPKHKEADNPTPSSVGRTILNADSSASIAEHRCESHVGLHDSFKKSMPVNQHTGSWDNTAALQKDASEWPVLNAMQKATSNLLLQEKIEGEGTSPLQPHHLPSKYSENRPTKPKKDKHRPNGTVVPIKNFIFLPPIESPLLNPQKASGRLSSGKRAPQRETIEEKSFVFDKKSGTRGTRVDPIANPELPIYSAALASKYRTCQCNPHLFTALSVSIPKRHQVPMPSKPDAVHHTTYSMRGGLMQTLHSSTTAGAQAHMHPSKTVCM